MLVALNRWMDDGAGPLHKEWTGLGLGAWESRLTHGDLTGSFLPVLTEKLGLIARNRLDHASLIH